MIINKVIVGFVVQKFDSETRQFVGQEFIGSDERHWECQNGDLCELGEIYGNDGVDEPYLNMEMIQPTYEVKQPSTSDLPTIPLNVTPLVAKSTSFEVGEKVLVTPSDNVVDLVRNEFVGTVVMTGGNFVSVKDADDDVFDVYPVQCHHLK